MLALVLGLIPGVGAVYNGQYAKGVVHVVIFGGLISLLNSNSSQGAEVVLVLLAILMFFYMPLEAFRTARAIERGQPVDELSGFLEPGKAVSGSPVGGIVLIVLGVVFLMQSLGYLRLASLLPYWPVSLIALGIYMLYRRAVESAERETRRVVRSSVGPSSGILDLGAEADERAAAAGETEGLPELDRREESSS